jgi:hypothetical protein
MYRVIFYMFFGPVVAEEKNKPLEWSSREEAERWARANCGPNAWEVTETL